MRGSGWWRRERLQGCEGKLRAAIQEKSNLGLEKAALERELKGIRGQTGKITKVQLLHPLCVDALADVCAHTYDAMKGTFTSTALENLHRHVTVGSYMCSVQEPYAGGLQIWSLGTSGFLPSGRC